MSALPVAFKPMSQHPSHQTYRIVTADLSSGGIIYWLEAKVPSAVNGNGHSHADPGWSRIAGSFRRPSLLAYWRALDVDPDAVMPEGVFRAGTPTGFIRNVRFKLATDTPADKVLGN